jgi:hypothetical protein
MSWHSRLVVEKHEMATRISKLSKFQYTELFMQLDDEDQTDLREQLAHMKAYHKVLQRRLNRHSAKNPSLLR